MTHIEYQILTASLTIKIMTNIIKQMNKFRLCLAQTLRIAHIIITIKTTPIAILLICCQSNVL
jgi:hypothetical protein